METRSLEDERPQVLPRYLRGSLAARAVLAALPLACATLGTVGEGDRNLPTANIGPFRKLASTEVLATAPYVVDSPLARYREPAALALDASGESQDVALYVVAEQNVAGKKHDAIVRTRADDARSFYGATLSSDDKPELVLSPDAPWEGGGVRSPSVLRVGERVYLYYAAAGGIGLAVSTDGVAFQKKSVPVLTADPAIAWETTPPAQPSVAVFPDGSWHMLYAAGVAIGEAISEDGETWSRVDADPSTPVADPVLAPLAAGPLAPDAAPPFDVGQVADPCLAPRVTPAGRVQVRVLYTGYDGLPGAPSRASAIGFAARFGDSGRLVRAGAPVYSVGKHEAAPALFEWREGAMLYVQQDSASAPVYPAIAAALSPANTTLPRPTGYATSP